MVLGYVLVYAYVQVMVGKFNRVEQRVRDRERERERKYLHTSLTHQALLGAAGILNCFLASVSSFGLCSLFGLDYGPMHSIIPCLLVGLGVDDVFVIVQVRGRRYTNLIFAIKNLTELPNRRKGIFGKL